MKVAIVGVEYFVTFGIDDFNLGLAAKAKKEYRKKIRIEAMPISQRTRKTMKAEKMAVKRLGTK